MQYFERKKWSLKILFFKISIFYPKLEENLLYITPLPHSIFLSTCGPCYSFIVLEWLTALASSSRSGVRRTVVTPKEILPFVRVRVCVSPTLCRRRRRPRYMCFVFSLCHYRLVLLPSRIFPLPARSAIPLFSSRPSGALFCVKPPPRGTHIAATTTKQRDGTYRGPQG